MSFALPSGHCLLTSCPIRPTHLDLSLFPPSTSLFSQVAHGDLKCENILVTSSLSIYITDFSSSFKPTYLPLDDPADFSYFFDTSGRRTCYVAPERFFENGDEIKSKESKDKGVGASKKKSTGDGIENGNGNGDVKSETSEEDPSFGKRSVKVSESMDVFSLGCVIAELWRDGSPIFTLSQLFKYREGLFDLEPSLNEITDLKIREMVKGMVDLEPERRGSFETLLKRNVEIGTFPDSFEVFLHDYLMELQKSGSGDNGDGRINGKEIKNESISSNHNNLGGNPSVSGVGNSSSMAGPGTTTLLGGAGNGTVLKSEADERIERLYEEWTLVVRSLESDLEVRDSAKTKASISTTTAREKLFQEVLGNQASNENEATNEMLSGTKEGSEKFLPVEICIPGVSSTILTSNQNPPLEDGTSLIILSVILSNLRNCIRPSSKLHALDLLLHLSFKFLTDETKLDRVLPFLVSLLNDPSSLVRASSIRNLTQILMIIKVITPSNAWIIPEYILPNISHLRLDESSFVRTIYSVSIVWISVIGERFLQMSSAMNSDGMFLTNGNERGDIESNPNYLGDFILSNNSEDLNYDSQLQILQNLIQDQVTKLLTEDPSPSVKRALLENLSPLCKFFGLNGTNDILISHMITHLNDKSWELRASFFDSIVQVALTSGERSLKDYILPLMIQALSDIEEFVILKVIKGFIKLNQNLLLEKSVLLDLMGILIGYLCHPNFWIKESVSAFISAACSNLTEQLDIWILVYPSLRPLLSCEIPSITQLHLLENLKPPLTRLVFQAAVTWASKAWNGNSLFWKPPKDSKGKEGLGNHLGKEGIGLMVGKNGGDLSRTLVHRNEEDDSNLDKLRALGMGSEDEVKLVAMRDYILKLSRQSTR